MRILIIEDEKKTAEFLRKGLTESGFITDVAENGEDGLFNATSLDYDLVVLDAMLPRKDGWSVLAEMRRQQKSTPVLFLTARDSVSDRVKGLDLGADDYLVKPYAFTDRTGLGGCRHRCRHGDRSGARDCRSGAS
jgi:two-component system copper resistance phosphate regulon response regulator CusR